MGMRLKDNLEGAGLGGDKTVTPNSIRNGIALGIRNERGLEAAAEQLDHMDMSFVMGELGLRPRSPVRERR